MNNRRRKFLASIGMLAASFSIPINAFSFHKKKKLKLVLVGTGIRGTSFWGKRLVEQYSEILELKQGDYSEQEVWRFCFGVFLRHFTSTTDQLVSIKVPIWLRGRHNIH